MKIKRMFQIVLLAAVVAGCSDSGMSESEKQAIMDQMSVSQQVVTIELEEILPTSAPLVMKVDSQLKLVSQLSGLEQKVIANKILIAGKLIQESSGKEISSFDILNWLSSSDEVGMMLTNKTMEFDKVLALYAASVDAL